MHKQEYLKSSDTSNDELDVKKYSFELQKKNHFVCQNKWSLIYMLEVVLNGINNNLHKVQHKVHLSNRQEPRRNIMKFIWRTQKHYEVHRYEPMKSSEGYSEGWSEGSLEQT